MKKILLIGSIALVGALAIAGCGEKESVYDTLADLAAKDYSTITLEVKTTIGSDELTGTYTTTVTEDGYTVTYEYEKFNTSFEGTDLPASAKTTYKGALTVKNDVVEVTDGEAPEFSVGLLTTNGLNFEDDNFTNTSESLGKVTATVTDVNGFLGKEFTATGMTMEVIYTSTKLTSLTLSYTNGNTQIVLVYTFD